MNKLVIKSLKHTSHFIIQGTVEHKIYFILKFSQVILQDKKQITLLSLKESHYIINVNSVTDQFFFCENGKALRRLLVLLVFLIFNLKKSHANKLLSLFKAVAFA